MKKTRMLLLCLAVAGAILPMTAHAESGNQDVSVNEAAAIPESNAPEAGVVADQMKAYYLSETGPQGNTFYASGVSAMPLPETCLLYTSPSPRDRG